MKIQSIELHNVQQFESLKMPLAPTPKHPGHVTVLIGNNGTGKTALLHSLATSLSWLVARLRREQGNGRPIPEQAITNGAHSANITLHINTDKIQLTDQADTPPDTSYQWRIAKTLFGYTSEQLSDLTGVSKLAEHYRTMLTTSDTTSLPLIVFYTVERVVLDIPLKIKNKHTFSQMDGYDNALGLGVDFRRFFEWFREREDIENETGISQTLLKELQKKIEPSSHIWQALIQAQATSRDRQLMAVRQAIKYFMPGFSNLKIRRKPRLHMSIEKQGETLDVAQLSQGEKSLMALVGDIARRLAMMNPALENPLQGQGIVLIDEIDMHLHPRWQRSIIDRLTTTFPACQFVLTTHSPIVISEPKDILVYTLGEGEPREVTTQYGQDVNSVLLDVMDTDIRNQEVAKKLNALFEAIQTADYEQAHVLIIQLESEIPDNHIELIKARLLLRKQELNNAQN